METLIQAMVELNKKLEEVAQTMEAIVEDMKKIAPLPWGSESDNKNGDNQIEGED